MTYMHVGSERLRGGASIQALQLERTTRGAYLLIMEMGVRRIGVSWKKKRKRHAFGFGTYWTF